MDDAGFGADHGAQNATWADMSAWIETDIPRRPWLAVGYLLRGAVTVVVGPGGVSKSALMLAYGVALVLGQEYNGMRPQDEYKVMVFNAEDDNDEQKRRLSAVLTSLGKSPADIAGKLLRIGPERVATLLERDPEDDSLVRTDAMADLEAEIAAFKPDVLILDPFVELHTDEENANTALRQVVAELRAIAKKANLALVLVHHTRKGIVTPGDMDAARGASAVVSAARVVLTVTAMTEEEEKALGMPTGSRQNYFRLDGAKSNYAPLVAAEWFERHPYELANGDRVAVPQPWYPPVDAITPELQVTVESAIRRGSPQGPYSPQLGNTPRSVKHALVEAGITTRPGQQDMLAAIFRGGFQTLRFRDSRRKFVNGIRSPDGQPSSVTWEDEENSQCVDE